MFKIIPNLVSDNRELIFHSDLISLKPFVFDRNVNESSNGAQKSNSFSDNNKKKKTDSNTSNILPGKKEYHLILFTDILLLTTKEQY